MEKKIKGERYATLSSFLADIQLIRDNCHTYNTGNVVLLTTYLLTYL